MRLTPVSKKWFVLGVLKFQKWFDVNVLDFLIKPCCIKFGISLALGNFFITSGHPASKSLVP
jgi:hypothetical protein